MAQQLVRLAQAFLRKPGTLAYHPEAAGESTGEREAPAAKVLATASRTRTQGIWISWPGVRAELAAMPLYDVISSGVMNWAAATVSVVSPGLTV